MSKIREDETPRVRDRRTPYQQRADKYMTRINPKGPAALAGGHHGYGPPPKVTQGPPTRIGLPPTRIGQSKVRDERVKGGDAALQRASQKRVGTRR